MDDLVKEKLKAMGYKEVPKELASIIVEYKKRQDCVRPSPLSLDAIVTCTLMYEMFKARSGKKDKPEQDGQDGQEE